MEALNSETVAVAAVADKCTLCAASKREREKEQISRQREARLRRRRRRKTVRHRDEARSTAEQVREKAKEQVLVKSSYTDSAVPQLLFIVGGTQYDTLRPPPLFCKEADRIRLLDELTKNSWADRGVPFSSSFFHN